MALKSNLPSWLSLLYVPAHDLARVASAHRYGAHGVVLDLEDFVPAADKALARSQVALSAGKLRENGTDVIVRINRMLDAAVADIDHAVTGEVNALMITKVASADHLKLLDELVGTLEIRRGLEEESVKFIAMIETADAIGQMHAIAKAVDRTVAMNIGGEDIARECAMRASAETLLYPKQQMILAANAAGILPLGYLGSVLEFTDPAGFSSMVSRSKTFGFQAATCVRPEQVEVVNALYAPSEDDIEQARRIIEASDVPQSEILHETRVIADASELRRARLVLARSARQE